mmetsp:Transcript_2911/g.6283  ORF Transcript_2911/g.6283 Transcript_2911/m.6283 type:complete len:128 (-) Transcript_2911:43-426(-)
MSNSTHNSTVSAPPAAAAVPNKEPTCSIDTHILNEETLPEMTNIALSFFASACGKNRGAFVLDPPDGQTYGWYVASLIMECVGCFGKRLSLIHPALFSFFLLILDHQSPRQPPQIGRRHGHATGYQN